MVNSVNPFLPEPIYAKIKKGVQVASPDIILDDPYMSVESMADYIFATIGGTEILSASRSDLIDSPLNKNYTPIADAGAAFVGEPSISFSDSSENIFIGYGIDLNRHVPIDDIAYPLVEDGTNGTIKINLRDMKPGYYVEVEILTNGDLVDGTI
jgi:hypothetical protein